MKDSKQEARAAILRHAMEKYTEQRMEEISANSATEEEKVERILSGDSEMAAMYKKQLSELKEGKH